MAVSIDCEPVGFQLDQNLPQQFCILPNPGLPGPGLPPLLRILVGKEEKGGACPSPFLSFLPSCPTSLHLPREPCSWTRFSSVQNASSRSRSWIVGRDKRTDATACNK